ncbi:MAG TPA: hypothetical protein VK427_12150 [Kofleriaceae bacterium]|nr:hypothetical protein [Kofleriaceae bacterium]
MIRGLVIGIFVALMIASCVARQVVTGPRLTGTCDGACAYYASCKTGGGADDKRRCTLECPDVFSDRDSLMAYESLSCPDAVEYIDGSDTHRTAAKPVMPASQPAAIRR